MAPYRIQPTPNPNSLKFAAADQPFIDTGMQAFSNAEQASGHPLGEALFSVDGVDNVLILPAFVTVSKAPAADWNSMLPGIERVLQDYLSN